MSTQCRDESPLLQAFNGLFVQAHRKAARDRDIGRNTIDAKVQAALCNLRSLASRAACFALQAAFFAARVLRAGFFIAGISTPIARAPIFDNNLRLDTTILASYGLISRRWATSVRVIVRIGHVFACSMSASIAAWAAVLLAIIGDA